MALTSHLMIPWKSEKNKCKFNLTTTYPFFNKRGFVPCSQVVVLKHLPRQYLSNLIPPKTPNWHLWLDVFFTRVCDMGTRPKHIRHGWTNDRHSYMNPTNIKDSCQDLAKKWHPKIPNTQPKNWNQWLCRLFCKSRSAMLFTSLWHDTFFPTKCGKR